MPVSSLRLVRVLMSDRRAESTCPVQFMISAVVSPPGVPSTRKSSMCLPLTDPIMPAIGPTPRRDLSGFRRSRLGDCPGECDEQRGPAGRTAQDHLADRQRPARQRRRLGLQDLRPRDALLPLHLREPHRLPQRGGAHGGQRRTSTTRALADADAEFGREETVKEKGFYILPQELFANVREQGAPRREPQRDPRPGLHATSRARRSAPTARTTSRACSTTSTSTAASSARRWPSATRSSSSSSTRSATCRSATFNDNTIDLFGDAYEYLMQMYASTAGKSGGEFYTPQEVSELLARITVVGKTEVNKVYDPACGSGSLLLKFAKVLGHEERAAGVLRPGGQPDDLQPVPDQHVPARHQLRAVRHRPRRHPDRPGPLGRRAVRGDRLQPALLDQVGRRREPAADQRPALRTGRRARAEVARPTWPSRCTS